MNFINWNLFFWLILIIISISIFIGFIIFIIKKIKNKNNKVKGDNQNNAQDENMKNLNTNKIKITIFRPISKDSVAQVGQPFIAEEKMDKNGNTIVLNEDKNFKEEFNFSIERVYEVMDFSLKLRNKTLTEKAKILDERIIKQENLLLEIENDTELNIKYNYNDEDLKLKQLKVYRDSLKKEKQGNYMRFGTGGVRMYEFVSIDGILYPYFFGCNFFRVYPDLLIKKKIFNSENTIFNNENFKMLNQSLTWIPVILLIIGMLLTTSGAYWNYKNYQASNDMNLKINQGVLTCQNVQAGITSNYGNMLDEYMKMKKDELEMLKKNQVDSNIIDNSKKNLIIDPSNIIPNKK